MEEILMEVKKQIDALLCTGKFLVIAIDGNCTAGKTTLAAMLEKMYDCNVFHMDDFFLRPEQRTPERYAQPGGNVDYERFREEVLVPLLRGGEFSYQPFSCKTFTLSEPVKVQPKKLNIIEGTYCLHPYFGDVYDWKVFLSVDARLQRSRILSRPQHLHERFFQHWIPMEQRYFAHHQVVQHCDAVYSCSGEM